MLFKLSIKNMKKSFKDYGIYFLTLVLGVAIFYMFNSLDSQEAMLKVSSSMSELIKLMISMLGMVSIFVAIILGLLIVYANYFLINRRKKEFGIYMTLGMGRRQISKIILLETIFVGVISLIIGLICGIFISQFMSILVAKLFEADMSNFTFVFSKAACIKTCIYFAVMYLAVIIFNTFTVSKYKLINLLNAAKKNERVKIKNPILSIAIFIISSSILAYCYYKVTAGIHTLDTVNKLIPIIIMGVVSTILIFWSLSGFILKVVQQLKNVYLKDTNMFVLRQINNKVNTTVIGMSVICLMLFITITILSSALSLRNTMQRELKEMTPVDVNLNKTANLPEKYVNKSGKEVIYTKKQIEDSKLSIQDTLKNNEFNINVLKDIVEIPVYATNDLTVGKFLEDKLDEIKASFPHLAYDMPEEIIKISDYNKIAKLYGIEEYNLNDNEYIMVCDFDGFRNIRNKVLAQKSIINIAGKEYVSKYNECKSGYIEMSTSHVNTGIILVPDNCNLTEDIKERYFLAANYNTTSDEEKKEIENYMRSKDSGFVAKLNENGIDIDGMTKIVIIESSVGIATIVTFIAIYLGIIFLIASSAILALKQLTESSDNKQRYTILREIGCDEKLINKSLFIQIFIFFMMPLALAIVHSVFGIQFALNLMSSFASKDDLIPSVIATVIIIGGIYGVYFMATYQGSKRIIKEK